MVILTTSPESNHLTLVHYVRLSLSLHHVKDRRYKLGVGFSRWPKNATYYFEAENAQRFASGLCETGYGS